MSRIKTLCVNYWPIIRYIEYRFAGNWTLTCSTENTVSVCVIYNKIVDFCGSRPAHVFPCLSSAVVLLIGALKIYFVTVNWLAWECLHFAGSVNRPTTSYFCSQKGFNFILKGSAALWKSRYLTVVNRQHTKRPPSSGLHQTNGFCN